MSETERVAFVIELSRERHYNSGSFDIRKLSDELKREDVTKLIRELEADGE